MKKERTLKSCMKMQYDLWEEFVTKKGQGDVNCSVMGESSNSFGKLIKGFQVELETAKIMKREPDFNL